jgi:hypothetical protein
MDRPTRSGEWQMHIALEGCWVRFTPAGLGFTQAILELELDGTYGHRKLRTEDEPFVTPQRNCSSHSVLFADGPGS